mmetsp:Transcript_9093/g.23775  ORF Transcript_9093/g.23775 Transcript_9093/m.23775 type:complete len:151 (-) Transcript_9093:249-701(-)|eukprot:CAMPEP_0117558278 /NCGR_PEP_ID=MMETSP0784-20121206/52751_1 /TAXON_ID=39447 /ORGANISM="" /LENGTH=150 /DNA_ID=CAMNT_0005355597 /DNA_START=70 /DNA_END=522 /DNA_ORIENTATION=+
MGKNNKAKRQNDTQIPVHIGNKRGRWTIPMPPTPTDGTCIACGECFDLSELHISSTGWYRCNDAAQCNEAAEHRDAVRHLTGPSSEVNYYEKAYCGSLRGRHRTRPAWDALPPGWHWEFDGDSDALYYWHEDHPDDTTWNHPTTTSRTEL